MVSRDISRDIAVGLAGLAVLLTVGCRRESPPADSHAPAAAQAVASADATRLRVAVSVLPQAQFVERVGGEHVDVQVLVGPGQSPHTYEPTAQQLATLAEARLLFSVGMPYEEALLARIRGAFERLETVDTRQGIALRQMESHGHAHDHDGHDHVHGPSCAGHDGEDPHIWLSPRLAKIQARTICDALCRVLPERADEFKRSLAAFHEELDALDARIAALLAPLAGRELVVFHPSYGYFADAYGLRQVAVETAGKEPSPRELAALLAEIKAAGTRVIFTQPQFSTRSAETIAAQIGGRVVHLDPLARDYVANLEIMATTIAQALAED